MHFTRELEEELADMNMKHVMFHKDSDREVIMRSIDIQRVYPHSPGPTCSEKGEHIINFRYNSISACIITDSTTLLFI